MKARADKQQSNSSRASSTSRQHTDGVAQLHLGHGEQPAQMRKLADLANNSPHNRKLAQLATDANQHATVRTPTVQKKSNSTGLPNGLKNGIERLSGYAMDDVKVHHNSHAPAQLHAHAFAQGTEIHIAPGQQRHLPHEAWHVVQQKQGRVRPTAQLRRSLAVNDDPALEQEADTMGALAAQAGQVGNSSPIEGAETMTEGAVQRRTAGSTRERDVVQRQIIATKPNSAGVFTFDHLANVKTLDDIFAKVEVEIAYKLNDDAVDERRVYLSQIVQHRDLTSGMLYDYSASNKSQEHSEAARDIVRTKGTHGEEAGFFVDRIYATKDVGEDVASKNSIRTSRLDAPQSNAYNMMASATHGRDGRKEADTSIAATLKDSPGAGKPTLFRFETAALGDTNKSYGILPWRVELGKKNVAPVITVSDATDALSKNFTEANYEFNEYFGNPLAATSPERFSALLNVPERGLTGFMEAVLTLERLTERVEALQRMPGTPTTATMIEETKDLIRLRFETIELALHEASREQRHKEAAAEFLEVVKLFRGDAVLRIGEFG